MKKKILTVLAGTMLVSSVSFAAPITDLQKSETSVGYNHYNLDTAGHNFNDDSFYLENGVTDKLVLGLEANSYSAGGSSDHTTDIYAQYKLDPNVRLIAGNRNYSDGPNKMFYGVGVNANLSSKVDGYASVTTSSIATEWQTGLEYSLNKQTALHLGYKSYKEDGLSRADGLGFGASYKF
ncbi:MAG: hypothetical protein H6Q72_560 [Firmicutes bacterium]|nr:hypothetical protein [Bacillota bacterium]